MDQSERPSIENPMVLAVMSQPPFEAGWYYVQFRATEWPRPVWVWEGGEMWGFDPLDAPEHLDITADDHGTTRDHFIWRKAP